MPLGVYWEDGCPWHQPRITIPLMGNSLPEWFCSWMFASPRKIKWITVKTLSMWNSREDFCSSCRALEKCTLGIVPWHQQEYHCLLTMFWLGFWHIIQVYRRLSELLNVANHLQILNVFLTKMLTFLFKKKLFSFQIQHLFSSSIPFSFIDHQRIINSFLGYFPRIQQRKISFQPGSRQTTIDSPWSNNNSHISPLSLLNSAWAFPFPFCWQNWKEQSQVLWGSWQDPFHWRKFSTFRWVCKTIWEGILFFFSEKTNRYNICSSDAWISYFSTYSRSTSPRILQGIQLFFKNISIIFILANRYWSFKWFNWFLDFNFQPKKLFHVLWLDVWHLFFSALLLTLFFQSSSIFWSSQSPLWGFCRPTWCRKCSSEVYWWSMPQ